ncbi:hypothetical protein [Nodularia sphaerocarpa]|uniref:hypothetical protein n=1 Tax=Nodularia sphaerocarpa TaxID=137816 RepID=UPI001EFB0249|nr:hypothetical protein [Nodularia sphaerocarpa]MDB9375463.1 hypothetical protein [Nodularia sphaerocarpa CS-585]MDB9379814.1 hypothetical protein [Nodularia sphaerocarpa CS-585A2]
MEVPYALRCWCLVRDAIYPTDAINRLSTREMAKLGTTRLIKVHSIGQPILA